MSPLRQIRLRQALLEGLGNRLVQSQLDKAPAEIRREFLLENPSWKKPLLFSALQLALSLPGKMSVAVLGLDRHRRLCRPARLLSWRLSVVILRRSLRSCLSRRRMNGPSIASSSSRA